MPVSDRDRFLFDLQGFLLLEGALSPDEISAYRAAVRRLESRDYDDSWMANHLGPADAKPEPTKHGAPPRLRMNGLLRLDDAFHALIDHPRILPYLEEFMDGPQVINTWSITKGPDAPPSAWHRGTPAEQYSVRNGKIRTAMLNVVWFLDDNGPEDGCMVAVPGSHKNGIDLDIYAFPHEQMPGMRRIVGKAGDVFLFSESVFHDGARKTTPGTRTNLYFNYGARSFNVMTYSPEHNRHFCMPPEVRSRFSAKQREMTSWMEHCLAIEAPEPLEARR
jgi:ectoine hydroxylase-related dioxygenase (phytanoyl-CoA dioxygenase family)